MEMSPSGSRRTEHLRLLHAESGLSRDNGKMHENDPPVSIRSIVCGGAEDLLFVEETEAYELENDPPYRHHLF